MTAPFLWPLSYANQTNFADYIVPWFHQPANLQKPTSKILSDQNALLCRTLFKSKGGDWMNKEGGARIWEQRSKIRQRWRRKGYTNIFCPIFCFILNAYIVLLDINTLFQYLYIVTNRTRYYTMIFCQRYVHSLIAVTQKLLAINLKAPCVVASGPMKAFRHFFRKFHLSPWGGSPLHPSSDIYPSPLQVLVVQS